LPHFVGVATWPDAKVLAKVREMALPAMQQHGADRGVDHRRHGFRRFRRAGLNFQCQKGCSGFGADWGAEVTCVAPAPSVAFLRLDGFAAPQCDGFEADAF
jgi:hypothetical protein